MIEETEVSADAAVISPASTLPLSGWALEQLVVLDEARPGLLAQLMRAGPKRHQTIYACLSAKAIDRPRSYADLLGDGRGWHGAIWPALLAEALLTARPRDLLQVSFGSVPDGLIGALGRCGPDPLPQAVYGRLHALYSDPTQTRRQRLLSSVTKMTEQRLGVVEALPECALHQKTLQLARHVEEAEEIAAAVDAAMRFSGATPGSIYKSLSDLSAKTSPTKWIDSLLTGFTLSARQPCLEALPDARLLDTGDKLRGGGRHLRNCLGQPRHCIEVMFGRAAYVVLGDPEVIAVMRALGDSWCVTRLYAAQNAEVPASQRVDTLTRLAEAGFPTVGGEPDHGTLDQLRDMCWDVWQDDFDEI